MRTRWRRWRGRTAIESGPIRYVKLITVVLCSLSAGCGHRSNELVVYTALDAEFSQPIFDEFARRTSLRVRPRYDVEAAKTVGLVQLILQEQREGVARCDVFWNNEILGTLRLLQADALEPLQIAEAEQFPPQYRSADGYWFGFAARARVLLYNKNLLSVQDLPTSVLELSAPRWRGRFAIANPLFGTTNTHMVCLWEVLGEERARDWIRSLWENEPVVLPGNRHVAEAVASGRVPVGLTDTDDALGQLEKGAPVEIIFPDQDGMGTLLIPNTVAAIRGARNLEGAKALIEYLLSRETEKRLALGPSGQIPLRKDLQNDPEVLAAFPGRVLGKVRPMVVDFEAAARSWQKANKFLETLLD